MGIEGRGTVDGIDHRDDALQAIPDHEVRVVDQGVQDRGGIGEAGRLDHQPAERLDTAVVALAQQVFQGGDQVAAHGAAQAAGAQQDHVLVDPLDQQMVEADLAELVDDDHGVGQGRIAQHPVEQRRLAGAEESGEDGERDRLGGAGIGLGQVGHDPDLALPAAPLNPRECYNVTERTRCGGVSVEH